MSRTLFRNGKLRESQVKLVNDESKFITFEHSTNSLKVMLISQRSPSSKGGLGFNKNEASSSGTIQVKFVKPVEVLAGNGSVTKEDRSLSQGSVDLENSQNATKLNFKPTTSFRSDFLIVKKKSIQKANENTIRQPLRLSLKNGLGFVKTESRSKTPPPRRINSFNLDLKHHHVEEIIVDHST
ncbi:hypothetical protein Tco_0296359 [Tanacetum coccineum]